MDKVLLPINVLLVLLIADVSHTSVAGFIDRDFRWDSASTIPVCFDNPTTENLAGRQMIEYIVKNSWEKVANINFDFKTTSCGSTTKGVLIKITDTVKMVCGTRRPKDPGRPGTCTYWNPNTKKAEYARVQLNFTFKNFKGVMAPVAVDTALRRKQINRMIFHYTIHEFGHALGFKHEDDRVAGKDSAKAGPCQDDDGDLEMNGMPVSYYDIHSVMHYLCNHAGNWPNGPPVTLSCGDMSTVRWMYGDRNTNIGPSCLKSHAKNLSLPTNSSAGYSVPAGGYEIGSGSDTYQTVVNPVYSNTGNGWYREYHTMPNGHSTYPPTEEPKIDKSLYDYLHT